MFASKSSNRLVRGITSFAFVVAFLIFASTAFAGQRFTAVFSGAQEVPPTGSTAKGYGYVEVNDAQTTITAYFGFSGLGTAATAAHIHTGTVGVSGPITFGFAGFPLATSGTHTQTFAITAGQLATLQAGGMYFNVHSSGFPGGEIRGQILAPTCATAGPIEVESTSGTAIGVPTAYATLQASFDAINLGVLHTGAINVEVCGNTTEVAAAILNSNAAAPASYTSVNVYPLVDGVSISGSGSGGGRGLVELNGADNVTIDGDNPNTGGTNRNLTINNTSIGTFHSVIRVALATTIITSADNNTFKNLALIGGATGRNNSLANSTTGTENTTYGVLVTDGASTVSQTTAPSTIASTVATIGLGATASNLSVTNNTITNVARAVSVQGADVSVANGLLINNNIIGNATAGAADGVYAVGISVSGGTGQTIRGNTVYVEGWIPATPSNHGIAAGVFSTATTAAVIEKNQVNRVFDNNTGGFNAYGINLGGGNNHVVRNNFVSGIKNVPNAAFSTSFGAFGIRLAVGTGHQIYNNSVNMTGTLLPGSTSSDLTAALGITSTTITGVDVRNNVLVNTQTHPTAVTPASTAMVSLYLPSGATVAMNLTLNNNDYFTGGAVNNGVGQAGTTAGTNFFTLAAFDPTMTTPAGNMRAYTNPLSAALTNDNASIKLDPGFPTASDLHVGVSSPVLNVGATIASVTDDIDGDARPLQGIYEIGADERLALSLPGDFRFSSATYGGNEGTSVTVTVQRFNGSTGAVSVQYAVTNGTATGGVCGSGGDYVGPTAPTTLNFADTETSKTFSVTLCTDAVTDPGETVNLALSNPVGGGVLGTPNTAVLTITDVPPPFSGTYTVGSGGNYPSLTNAGGIFEAMNLAGALAGSVTINITSDLTGELGTNALNEFTGAFTVLIKPSGAPRTITGSNAGGLIRLNGADGVTFDGSTTGATATGVGGNAALRELTIQNTNTGLATVISVGSNAANGAQNNTIKNVRVLGQDPTTSLLGISLGAATPGTAATGPNNNNRVENCFVGRVIFGIYSVGQTATPNTGTVITMNETSAVATDRIRRVGIFVFNENGIQITHNSINGISTTESADGIGIAVGTQGVDTTIVTSGGVSNALVARNKINGVNSASTVGFSAAGITVSGGTLGANTIANNMITGVTSPGTSPDFPAGIFVVGAAGSNTRLYYNSVSMTGNRDPLVAGQMPSYGIAITGTDPTVELKNNILYSTQTSSGGGANAVSYAIGMVTTTFVNLDSNYNDFFSTGANDGGFRSGSLAAAAGTNYATVALWGAAIADDANSITLGEVDPGFVDPLTNLHLKFSPVSPVLDKGIAVSVLDDFDGQIRSIIGLTDGANLVGGVPDIGADELGVTTAAGVTVGGRVMAGEGRGLRGAIVTMTSMDGTIRNVVTGAYGRFQFDDVEPGQTYIVSIRSRRFMYSPQTVQVNDNIADLSFVAGQ